MARADSVSRTLERIGERRTSARSPGGTSAQERTGNAISARRARAGRRPLHIRHFALPSASRRDRLSRFPARTAGSGKREPGCLSVTPACPAAAPADPRLRRAPGELKIDWRTANLKLPKFGAVAAGGGHAHSPTGRAEVGRAGPDQDALRQVGAA
jgi:hypothetical protein